MKKLLSVFIMLFLLFSLAIPAFANSAEPPGMIILCNDLPEGAKLTLETQEGKVLELRRFQRNDIAWESQYRLWFSADLEDWHQAVLRVTVGENSFTVALPDGTVNRYKTVLTLDYQGRSLTLGQEAWRQPVLTAIRIALTLLAESLVYWAFGFRKKRSWILFLIMNILTQAWLNGIINSNAFASGYWAITYYLAEIVIFLGETVCFSCLSKEHRLWKRICCPLAANTLSLIVGVLLISNLPI